MDVGQLVPHISKINTTNKSVESCRVSNRKEGPPIQGKMVNYTLYTTVSDMDRCTGLVASSGPPSTGPPIQGKMVNYTLYTTVSDMDRCTGLVASSGPPSTGPPIQGKMVNYTLYTTVSEIKSDGLKTLQYGCWSISPSNK